MILYYKPLKAFSLFEMALVLMLGVSLCLMLHACLNSLLLSNLNGNKHIKVQQGFNEVSRYFHAVEMHLNDYPIYSDKLLKYQPGISDNQFHATLFLNPFFSAKVIDSHHLVYDGHAIKRGESVAFASGKALYFRTVTSVVSHKAYMREAVPMTIVGKKGYIAEVLTLRIYFDLHSKKLIVTQNGVPDVLMEKVSFFNSRKTASGYCFKVCSGKQCRYFNLLVTRVEKS